MFSISNAEIRQAIREIEAAEKDPKFPISDKARAYRRILRWKNSPECRELVKDIPDADADAR